MAFFQKNVDLGPALQLSEWRKAAIGTWKAASDPSVYGFLDLNVESVFAYIEKKSRETGLKITLSHFASKAIAELLHRHPEINCLFRFGRIYPRKSVDVFILVATDKAGQDLSGLNIQNAEKKSIIEIAREMNEQVQAIRDKTDQSFSQMKKTVGRVPGIFSRYVLNFAEFFMYTLNLWVPWLGCPKNAFGSVMITNIGSLGLDVAFAPLVPYSRVPLMVSIGAAKETPIVQEGKVTVARMLRVGASFDHRIIDGVHASRMANTLRNIFAHPERELEKD